MIPGRSSSEWFFPNVSRLLLVLQQRVSSTGNVGGRCCQLLRHVIRSDDTIAMNIRDCMVPVSASTVLVVSCLGTPLVVCTLPLNPPEYGPPSLTVVLLRVVTGFESHSAVACTAELMTNIETLSRVGGGPTVESGGSFIVQRMEGTEGSWRRPTGDVLSMCSVCSFYCERDQEAKGGRVAGTLGGTIAHNSFCLLLVTHDELTTILSVVWIQAANRKGLVKVCLVVKPLWLLLTCGLRSSCGFVGGYAVS